MSSSRPLSWAVSGFVLVLLVGASSEVMAVDCRVNYLPNGKVFHCLNCHNVVPGSGGRNSFGKLIKYSGCKVTWDATVAAKDYDGDGITNGEELGDPTGAWRFGQPDPGDPSKVTNPGKADVVAGPKFLRGDANNDRVVDISDALAAINHLFSGGPALACNKAADVNKDNVINVADAIYLLAYLFTNGPRPPAPYTGCGSETTNSTIDCASSSCP